MVPCWINPGSRTIRIATPVTLAHDFCLSWIVESAHLLRRLRMRDNHQLPAIDLAPTACVAGTKFHKIDRAIEFRCPLPSADLPLVRVNLHEGAGTDQRIQGVVLKSDISVNGFAQIQMLQKANRNLVPLSHDPRKQIRCFQSKLRFELDRQCQVLVLEIRFATE